MLLYVTVRLVEQQIDTHVDRKAQHLVTCLAISLSELGSMFRWSMFRGRMLLRILTSAWNVCTALHRTELVCVLGGTVEDVKENLRSIGKLLFLSVSDQEHPSTYRNAQLNLQRSTVYIFFNCHFDRLRLSFRRFSPIH